MLGFGLTLMGGCVATTETGQPSELYFPAHSITAESPVSESDAIYTNILATPENMAASAQEGMFWAENVQKTGVRYSTNYWGLIGEKNDSTNAFFLTLCSKSSSWETDYCTNLNITRADNDLSTGAQPSLYVSGRGLFSPKFVVSVRNSKVSVTDSFSGEEQETIVDLPNLRAANNRPRYFYFARDNTVTYQFVVATYTNEGLGIRSRAQGMRTMPLAFGGSEALYESQTNTLKEL